MQFHDFDAANAYYAARYALFTGGQLSATALQHERQALRVTDNTGRNWTLDPVGRWVPVSRAPSSRALIIVVASLAGAVVIGLALVGLIASPSETVTALPTLAAAPAAPADVAQATPPVATGLVAELQRGGFVLYLRHAARDETPETVTDPADCSQQANLTEEGRQQAVDLGADFQFLRIPVGDVYASPYCRTTQTAQLAFGTVTPVAELSGASLSPPVDPAVQAATLEQLLSTPPEPGRNTVIVGHGEVVEQVTGEPAAGFAETVVFVPENAGYRAVTHVTYERLQQWVQGCPPDCS